MSEATTEPVVLVEDLGPVRRLTMNRPNALNALNGELIDGLSQAIRAAGTDPGVAVVILRGAGRAFCAGYDLNEDASGGAHDARHWHEELATSTEKMLEFTDCPKPTIAQVHSYCLAGGTDLMLACDLAVAADDSYFGLIGYSSPSYPRWRRDRSISGAHESGDSDAPTIAIERGARSGCRSRGRLTPRLGTARRATRWRPSGPARS